MPKLDISLPTTTGETASLSQLRGKAVFVLAESRSHSAINEPFKKDVQSRVTSNPELAKRVELVVVALMSKEPSAAMLRPMIVAAVSHVAKQAGLDKLWLDWANALPAKIGVPAKVDSPCYALLDKTGEVVWAAYGKISDAQRDDLVSKIHQVV